MEPTGEATDLIGDMGDSSEQSQSGGALDAVNQGLDEANQNDDKEKLETERKMVAELMAEYSQAREFDKPARGMFAMDRKYAAGLSDPSWASDANLIGSFIDILVGFLYAQNPDVSAKPSAQVGQQPDKDSHAFAETAELVVSKLWHKARLKRAIRKQVRAVLSTGQGWIKCLLWSEKRPQPQVEAQIATQEELLARVKTLSEQMTADPSIDEDVQKEKIAQVLSALRNKLTLPSAWGLSADLVRSEDIQVSLDVSDVMDYADAEWMAEDMYIPTTQLKARFPDLTDDDVKKATQYFQRNMPANAKGDAYEAATGEEPTDGAFSRTVPNGIQGAKPITFAKIIEFWDRRDFNIKTMIDGVERWAVQPYPAPYASDRFYPYFGLAFYPVDGQRHPQSLAWRLRKLQDEYSAARSNQRLTRERSIPGWLFHAGLISPEDANKLQNSVIAEFTPIKLTDPTMPVQNAFAPKPLPQVNPALWDTTAIRQDMEAIAGVQEAQQQNVSSQPKTATEAQIQQSGFASRTGADRDNLEDMLDEAATYTLQCGVQCIPPEEATRIAGPMAFWPTGMEVQDLLTLVEIEIDAGTTGKPNLANERANWGVILPLLQKMIVQIRQTQMMDPGLSQALIALLGETLKRMDDRLELDEFIPQGQPPPPIPPPTPPPSVAISLKGDLPPLDASVIGAKAAGLPPEAIVADGGANATAMQHASGMHEGELPPHPLMPEPLPAPKETPVSGGAKAAAPKP